MIAVVKIGTSSITDDHGRFDAAAIDKVCAEIAAVRDDGHQVVLVTSAAIAAGLPALGMSALTRPRDSRTLQAVSTAIKKAKRKAALPPEARAAAAGGAGGAGGR